MHHNVDHPVSLYAVSKKSNELMAYTSTHWYSMSSSGLRLFTDYGPWTRPDMALFNFTKGSLAGEKIKLFKLRKHRRNFTDI